MKDSDAMGIAMALEETIQNNGLDVFEQQQKQSKRDRFALQFHNQFVFIDKSAIVEVPRWTKNDPRILNSSLLEYPPNGLDAL